VCHFLKSVDNIGSAKVLLSICHKCISVGSAGSTEGSGRNHCFLTFPTHFSTFSTHVELIANSLELRRTHCEYSFCASQYSLRVLNIPDAFPNLPDTFLNLPDARRTHHELIGAQTNSSRIFPTRLSIFPTSSQYSRRVYWPSLRQVCSTWAHRKFTRFNSELSLSVLRLSPTSAHSPDCCVTSASVFFSTHWKFLNIFQFRVLRRDTAGKFFSIFQFRVLRRDTAGKFLNIFQFRVLRRRYCREVFQYLPILCFMATILPGNFSISSNFAFCGDDTAAGSI